MPPDLCKCSPNDPRVKTAVQQAERVQQRSNMRVPNYTTLFEIWWFGTWFKDFKGNPWKQTGWGEDPRSPKVSCHFSLNSQEGWTYCKYRHKPVKAKWWRNVHPIIFLAFYFKCFVVLCLDTSCGWKGSACLRSQKYTLGGASITPAVVSPSLTAAMPVQYNLGLLFGLQIQ